MKQSTHFMRNPRDDPKAKYFRHSAKIMREVAEHHAGRKILGTTMLELPLLNRKVHLWTVEDGEHILILEQNRSFLYWEASRDSLTAIRSRACDWLAEPPEQQINHLN